MSGVDRPLAEANQRWLRAADRARDVEDLGLGPAVKVYYTRFFPVLAFVCLALGAGVGLLTGEGGPPDLLLVLSMGCAFAMLGALVGGLVYNSKRIAPAVQLSSVDVLYVLTDAERKHINRQIAGRAALDHVHLPVVRAGAIQLRKGLATQLVVMPAYAFLIVGQTASLAIREDLPWLPGAMLVVGGALAALLVRDFKRTGRMVALTAGKEWPEPDPSHRGV